MTCGGSPRTPIPPSSFPSFVVPDSAWRPRGARQRGSPSPLVLYLWDLPPKGTAAGKHDPVWWLGGRFVRLPRPFGGYRQRAGYHSRLRYIASHAAALWTASGFTTATVHERFGLTGTTVPYCYDSARFHPGTEERDDPPVHLTVSRLERHKNQEVVLRAAALLGPRIHVRLIGRGPEEARLRALGEAFGVTRRLETTVDDPAAGRILARLSPLLR